MVPRKISPVAVAWLALALLASSAKAQVLVPFTPANQLSVSVSTNVTFDSSTGLYTYTYTLTNASTSLQPAWLFALQLNGAVTSASAPAGWTAIVHDDEPLLSWAATEIDTLPPGYVDDVKTAPVGVAIQFGIDGETVDTSNVPRHA